MPTFEGAVAALAAAFGWGSVGAVADTTGVAVDGAATDAELTTAFDAVLASRLPEITKKIANPAVIDTRNATPNATNRRLDRPTRRSLCAGACERALPSGSDMTPAAPVML